jgi:Tol biopolymer transport system component
MSRKGITTLLGSLVFLLFIGLAYAQVPMASFLSDRSGDLEVHLVYDNGEIEQLTKNKAKVFIPEWSPDGKFIAFDTNVRGGENFDVFLIDLSDPAKPKQTNLTGPPDGPGTKLTVPLWAPAGEPRILLYSTGFPNGDNWDLGLLTLDARGKADDLINITNADGEGTGQDQEGSWSPDGTKIVFEGERNKIKDRAQMDIFIADVEKRAVGKNQVNLTNHEAPDQRARWSPDSKAVVFQSKRDGNWEIYTVGIDGENLTRITENDKTDRRAEWSPGGIVFETNRDGNYEIYRSDPDGNNQVNLSNDPKSDSKPIWSPKGTRILFESKRDGKREIYFIQADGAGLKNLTNHPENDTDARWNPVFELRSVEPQQKHFTTLGDIKRTSLMQNFPNPFNPETWIPYYLAETASVTVRIYNVKGELIRSINVGRQAAGAYTTQQNAVYWDGKDETGQSIASGVYFYQLVADDFSETRRMVVMK